VQKHVLDVAAKGQRVVAAGDDFVGAPVHGLNCQGLSRPRRRVHGHRHGCWSS
jgi:hypothetical protein